MHKKARLRKICGENEPNSAQKCAAQKCQTSRGYEPRKRDTKKEREQVLNNKLVVDD